MEPTGEAFNSISLDPATGKPLNPMINAGAITAAGLVAERHGEMAESELLSAYGRHAGRTLSVDDTVYASESGTAHRNRAIAHLLFGAGAVRVEPEAALDLYLRQCSVLVDMRDLAVMAATLANGGVNPVTGERAAAADTVTKVLTVMTTCGMYDAAGQWLYDVGLPAKSGVGGGIIAVLPGRLGIAVFSPAAGRARQQRSRRRCVPSACARAEPAAPAFERRRDAADPGIVHARTFAVKACPNGCPGAPSCRSAGTRHSQLSCRATWTSPPSSGA